MIKIELRQGKESKVIYYPTKWEDITYTQFVHLYSLDKTIQAYFSFLTGIEDLSLVNDTLLLQLHELSLFLFDPATMQVEKDSLNINVATSPWQNVERLKQLLSKSNWNYLQSAPAIIELYTRKKNKPGIDISAMPVTKVLSTVHNLTVSISNFFSQFEELAESEQSFEQEQARIMEDGKDCFADLGINLTLYNISNRNVHLYQRIMKLPAIQVYNFMLVDKRVKGFDKRYFDLTKK